MDKINTHIMSDLHLNLLKGSHYDDFMEALTAMVVGDAPELAIIAGDFSTLAPSYKQQANKHFKAFSELYKQVIYIPGNHDFWDSSFEASQKVLDELAQAYPNIHMLNADNPFTFKGQRFVGDTMWFPRPSPTDPPLRWWSDNCRILHFQPEVFDKHQAFLEKVVAKIQPDDIVITHHFPFTESIAEKWKTDDWNCYFHADVSKYLTTPPKVWIHGHTHIPFFYTHPVIGTKVICNPKGYMFEGENDDFFTNLQNKL